VAEEAMLMSLRRAVAIFAFRFLCIALV